MNLILFYYISIHMIIAGIVNDAMETANMANSVNDADGVYFVPAFSGLQVHQIYY